MNNNNPTHVQAMQTNSEKLLKQNTQMNATINYLKEDHKNFVSQVNAKLERTIRMYDGCNTSVLEYLQLHNLVSDDHYDEICMMFPAKLGEKYAK